jgi:hypothetical protein
MELFTRIIFILLLIGGTGCETETKIKEYNRIVKKIDVFLEANKRTPTEQEFNKIIKSMGYQPSESCPCYNKLSNNNYELWFGLGLGTSMVYRSKTKKWSEEG